MQPIDQFVHAGGWPDELAHLFENSNGQAGEGGNPFTKARFEIEFTTHRTFGDVGYEHAGPGGIRQELDDFVFDQC